jgi:glutamine synthetase
VVTTPEQDFVLKTIESRDVHFVRFWFTDVLGNMKSFAVVPGELEAAFENGMGFDASCIEGFSAVSESDMLAFPDPSTFQVLPWRPQANAVARMICNIRTPEGAPYEGDPRSVLDRMVRKAAEMGYAFVVGPELEYFYFKDAQGTEVLDRGSYFDLTSLDSASDLRRDTVLTLEKMGIPVEYSHHEKGPSQHEIDLRSADALSMADAVMTYKQVVKEIAMKHGVYASFMPKPMADAPGNGMHVHQSLTDLDGNNVFFDENDPSGYNLSATAKSYIAGLLKYAPEYTLVTNQYVNSYKRLRPGGEAPTCISWGARNRATLVRIPGYRPRSEAACRVELRSPDPAPTPIWPSPSCSPPAWRVSRRVLSSWRPWTMRRLWAAAAMSIAPAALPPCPRVWARRWSCLRKARSCARCLASISIVTWCAPSAPNGRRTRAL